VFIGLVDFKTLLKKTPILFGLLLLGLSPYLYLPIRSAQNPPLDWGNPETLRQFFFHVSAAQYRNLMFSASSAHLLGQLNQFRMAIVNEFTIVGSFLGIIGIMSFIALKKEQPKKLLGEFLLLILIFLADLIYTINFYILDGQPFYIPSYLIFALFIGSGIAFLLDLTGTLFSFKKAVIFPISALLCLGLPLYALTRHYSYVDLSDFYEASEYGESAFQNLEYNALVFTSYDGPTFVLWYFQHVVTKRKDVTIISMPLLRYEWYLENIKISSPQLNILEPQANRSLVAQLVAANLANHPVYFFFPEEPPSFLQKYKLLKAGPLHRVLPSSAGE
jgi:hypothetical protein